MNILTRRDKAKIKAQIEKSEELVKEEAERTNAKLNKLIQEQAELKRRTANQIENAPKIAEAVRLLEINKQAYLESMNSLEKYITGLKEKTDVDFRTIYDVIERNKYVSKLLNDRQINYIKELEPKTASFATLLYDRYMDARQKIFRFATISIEEDESLLKSLVGIQYDSDSDSRSSRSSGRSRSRRGSRSRGRSSASSTKSTKSAAETDRIINEIFQFTSVLKAATGHAMGYFRPNGHESDSSVASNHPAVGPLPQRPGSATRKMRRTADEMRELMRSNFEAKQSSPAKSDASSVSDRSRSRSRSRSRRGR